MMKLGVALSFLALVAITACSQQPALARSQPEQLKGVTRLFVDTLNKDTRANIVNEIKKRLPQVTFTEKAEDAQVWLQFVSHRRAFPISDPTSQLGGTRTSLASLQYGVVANGAVLKLLRGGRALRLLDYRDTADTSVSRTEEQMSTGFAKAFVKAYRKANP
jgi:hypothetical protein